MRLDRPDKLNALDPAMFSALIEAGERLKRLHGLRAVVLHGAGRGFSAGLDMGSFAAIAAGGATAFWPTSKSAPTGSPIWRRRRRSSGARFRFR